MSNPVTIIATIAALWYLCGWIAAGLFIAYDRATDPDEWRGWNHRKKVRFIVCLMIPLSGTAALVFALSEFGTRHGWSISAAPIPGMDDIPHKIHFSGVVLSRPSPDRADLTIRVDDKDVLIYSGPWPATREALMASFAAVVALGLEAE